jgi:O-antigen ligase
MAAPQWRAINSAAPVGLAPAPAKQHPLPRTSLVDRIGILGLALLVGVGGFKAIPAISALPVDATLLAFALMMAGVISATLRSRMRFRRAVLLPIVLWASMYPALFFTEFEGESLEKTVLLFGVLFMCMVSPMILFRTSRNVRLFFILISAQGVLLSLGALGEFGADGRAGAYGANVLHVAQFGGVLSLMALAVALREKRWRMPLLAVAGMCLVAVVGSGTRAAVLGVIATAIIGLALSRGAPNTRLQRLSAGLVPLLGALWLAWQYAPERALNRIAGFMSHGPQDTSSRIRIEAIEVSLEGSMSAPFGIGVNNFGDQWAANSSSAWFGRSMPYPHNLIAETALELGWLPTILLIGMFILALVRAHRASMHVLGDIVLLSLIYTFSQSLSRGDITSHRLLMALIGLAIVLPDILRSETIDDSDLDLVELSSLNFSRSEDASAAQLGRQPPCPT